MTQRMENKKKYDFEVHVPTILGNNFKRVEILGYLPYETAILLNGELAPLHAEIFSTGRLPTSTPNDPRQYMYYRVKKMDGTVVMIGEPWIVHSTITETSGQTCNVRIPDVSAADLTRITDILKQSGFANFEIYFE